MVDEFLPVYDVSDSVSTVVDADLAVAWQELMDVDLVEVGRQRPMMALLGALRARLDVVSHVLHGALPDHAPTSLRLRDLTRIPLGDGGWVLLGERPAEQIAIGLVGKLWRPVASTVKVTPEGFRDFSEPGFAKTVYSFSVGALDERRTLLSSVMRTATTSDDARRRFRCSWTFGIGSGAHVLARSVTDLVREMAERRAMPADTGLLRRSTV
jgi:hypothetical protein